MSHLIPPPPTDTLAYLVWDRDNEFNNGMYREKLISRTMTYVWGRGAASDEVDTHRADFFDRSGMRHESWAYDLETTALWRIKSAGKNCGKTAREKFFQKRIEPGIEHIWKKTKFDLSMPVPQAFEFYWRKLKWRLLRELRNNGNVSLDDEESAIELPVFDSDPALGDRIAILMLAMADLPSGRMELAWRSAHGIPNEKKDANMLRALHVMRENLRHLVVVHEMAQSLDGRNLIKRVTRLLVERSDERLINDHFTVTGPISPDGCFMGLPLEAGDAVRFRLAQALEEIVSALEERRYKALLNLPCEKSAELLAFLTARQPEESGPGPSVFKLALTNLKMRKLFRDMCRLDEVYRRAKDGRSLYRMVNDPRLTPEQRKLLRHHLERDKSLEAIAESWRVGVEELKESLLAAATILINLTN